MTSIKAFAPAAVLALALTACSNTEEPAAETLPPPDPAAMSGSAPTTVNPVPGPDGTVSGTAGGAPVPGMPPGAPPPTDTPPPKY